MGADLCGYGIGEQGSDVQRGWAGWMWREQKDNMGAQRGSWMGAGGAVVSRSLAEACPGYAVARGPWDDHGSISRQPEHPGQQLGESLPGWGRPGQEWGRSNRQGPKGIRKASGARLPKALWFPDLKTILISYSITVKGQAVKQRASKWTGKEKANASHQAMPDLIHSLIFRRRQIYMKLHFTYNVPFAKTNGNSTPEMLMESSFLFLPPCRIASHH